jgi:hypothetical protein
MPSPDGDPAKVEVPVTPAERAIATENALLPTMITGVLAAMFAFATGYLVLQVWIARDSTNGDAQAFGALYAGLTGAATVFAASASIASWRRMRRGQRQMTTTRATGTICLSKRWAGRYGEVFSLTVGSMTFRIEELGFDAIRSRAPASTGDESGFCFQGMAQYAGRSLLRVEAPPGILIYQDDRLGKSFRGGPIS